MHPKSNPGDGNLLGYTDSVMGTWGFSYDQLDRLVTAANAAQPPASSPAVPAPSWAQYFCWAYDSFGNRLAQSQSSAGLTSSDGGCNTSGTLYQNVLASYNAQNQITSTNAPGYTLTPPTYDNAGDVTNDGKNQYLYDAEGRICAVSNADSMTGYLYDAAGNRVAKGTITTMSCDITSNGFQQTAGYVVGPSGEQLTEVDGSNNWVHTNVYAGGKLIGTYDGTASAPTMHYYFDDPLGTRRAQASSAGVLEAVYVSLPYGDGYAANTSDDPTENHFTGKERDAESGNDYFGARYYNSVTGRWLSPDWSASVEPVPYAKLGDPQSLNLYAYVGNNPITGIDADGHDMESDAIESSYNALGLDSLGNYSETVGDTVDSMMAAAEGPFSASLDAAAKQQSGAVRNLVNAQNAAMSNSQYSPTVSNGQLVTHCSEAACSIAQGTGANLAGILYDANGHDYPANTQINNLANPESGYGPISPEKAQALADTGVLVFATQHGRKHGHIASVRPEGVSGDHPRGQSGPILANVGIFNGVAHQSAVMTPAHGAIIYYAPNQ